jgi:GNAT superfamily N-acetyltransferase
MVEVIPYEERWLGSLLDYSVRAAPGFFFSWASNDKLFRWKLVDQPSLKPGEQVPVWLAVEGGRVIGIRASMLSDYSCDGQRIRGVVGCDYYVEQEYQGQGIGRELLKHSLELAPLHLHLNSSARAHGMHLHRGCREIKGLATYLTLHNPLAAAGWVTQRMLRGPAGRGTPRPIGKVRDWFCRQPGVVPIQESDAEEIDELLSSAQRQFDFAALRNSRFLLWKYRAHPELHGDVFTWHHNGKLAAVFALANQNRGGVHILVLADLYLRKPDAATVMHFARMLNSAAHVVRADASGIFGSWELMTKACYRGWLKYTRSHRASLLVEGCGHDLSPSSCYISAGDGDYLC